MACSLQRVQTFEPRFHHFGNIAKVVDDEQTVLEKYISYAYTKKELTLGDARWYTFTRKFGVAEKLPPTASSFKQHLLRAVYQTFVWKQSGKRLITYPDASNFGWRQVNGKWSPFPTDKPPVIDNIAELIKCNCTGKCDSRKCSCKRSNPPLVCTELCGCSHFCENVDPEEVEGIEDDGEDDENYD